MRPHAVFDTINISSSRKPLSGSDSVDFSHRVKGKVRGFSLQSSTASKRFFMASLCAQYAAEDKGGEHDWSFVEKCHVTDNSERYFIAGDVDWPLTGPLYVVDLADVVDVVQRGKWTCFCHRDNVVTRLNVGWYSRRDIEMVREFLEKYRDLVRVQIIKANKSSSSFC